ncbi:serine protease [Pseudonocardiaceae bacterium YIM PH 21723]|nr:serine protease [Pseudonocardiaceae bacterium YIM PH 21723]
MNWVDVFVLLIALLAAIFGARQGMFVALFSFAGVAIGGVIGVFAAPRIIDRIENPSTKILVGMATVIVLVALGETIGVWVGRRIRERIDGTGYLGIDNLLGALVQASAVVLVSWLIAVPLTSVGGLPGLIAPIKDSTLLSGVNDGMPSFAKGIPNDLRNRLGDSGFPDVLGPFTRTGIRSVDPVNEELRTSAAADAAKNTVFKIKGVAQSCFGSVGEGHQLEGTGFVIAPERLMTNAHVVAGTNQVGVQIQDGTWLTAKVVQYDPVADIAILLVPKLAAPPMFFDYSFLRSGSDVMALGYPGDGDYTISPLRLRERVTLVTSDIYSNGEYSRDTYMVRGTVIPGNSGGPMINSAGRVVGVVFGTDRNSGDTGFVMTAKTVQKKVSEAPFLNNPVATGECTGNH